MWDPGIKSLKPNVLQFWDRQTIRVPEDKNVQEIYAVYIHQGMLDFIGFV